ncbi:MAG: hypothetical protein ACOX5F_09920 [Anaerovoracaceae bacterium]
MTEKELKKDNPCGTGKVIDEYLDGTICEPEEEVEDVTSPGESNFKVHEKEEPETDDRYKDYL